MVRAHPSERQADTCRADTPEDRLRRRRYATVVREEEVGRQTEGDDLLIKV